MHEWTWLWIPASIFAAAAQAGRNAIQRSLTERLGTLGATQVRFLYGFPFALLIAALSLMATGASIPRMDGSFALFTLAGAMSQILATALMLAAMRQRAFVVVTAWTKTEPVQVAVFGMVVLGDRIPWLGMVAILIATVGVTIMARKPTATQGSGAGWQSVVMGLLAGACFAIAAVAYRGAILSLGEGHFLVNATWTVTCGLLIQTVALGGWMIVFQPAIMLRVLQAWRISIWGGLLGALASEGWFLGFALTAAANVRTLGLVEVLFAQILSRRIFLTRGTRQEMIGTVLIVAGVAMLLLV